VTDIACWITFFADGARRNSSRWDLNSRLGDTGCLRADGMMALLEELVRQFSVLDKNDGSRFFGLGISASRRRSRGRTRTLLLRLANLPNFALDRLSRYEATLWRQAGQILFALEALDRRKPQERGRRLPR
jgi:hypothetical protein